MSFLESTCAAHVGAVRASLALRCPQMHFIRLHLSLLVRMGFRGCLDNKQNCGPVARTELGYIGGTSVPPAVCDCPVVPILGSLLSAPLIVAFPACCILWYVIGAMDLMDLG